MAIGDKTTLVTQTYVEQTYDKKADGTDDLNTYDSAKRASAKAIALVNDRVDAIELALAGAGGNYTLPTATDTILGGVKVGAGLTITDGVLEATAQGSGGVTQIRNKYTASFGQTTFLATYSVGYVDVWLNGIKLDESEFTADTGTNIILTSGCLAGDTVQILGLSDITVLATYTQAQIDAKIGDIASMLDIINGTVV